jgi:hypothetical protein
MTKSKLLYRPTAFIKKKHLGAKWAIPGSPLKLMTCYSTILAPLQKSEGQQRFSSNSAEAAVVS